jgi:hypothetical protein
MQRWISVLRSSRAAAKNNTPTYVCCLAIGHGYARKLAKT